MQFMFGGPDRSLQPPADEQNNTRANPEQLRVTTGTYNRINGINDSHRNASDVSVQESTLERPEVLPDNAAHQETDSSNVVPENVANANQLLRAEVLDNVTCKGILKALKITGALNAKRVTKFKLIAMKMTQ